MWVLGVVIVSPVTASRTMFEALINRFTSELEGAATMGAAAKSKLHRTAGRTGGTRGISSGLGLVRTVRS